MCWLETCESEPFVEELFSSLERSDGFEVWRTPGLIGYQRKLLKVLGEPAPTQHMVEQTSVAAQLPAQGEWEAALEAHREAAFGLQAAQGAREEAFRIAATGDNKSLPVLSSLEAMISWIDAEYEARHGTANRKAAQTELRTEKRRLSGDTAINPGFVSNFVRRFGPSKALVDVAVATVKAETSASVKAAANQLASAQQYVRTVQAAEYCVPLGYVAGRWTHPCRSFADALQHIAGGALGNDAIQLVHEIRTRANKMMAHALDAPEERWRMSIEARTLLEESVLCLNKVLDAQLLQDGHRSVVADAVLGSGSPTDLDCVDNDVQKERRYCSYTWSTVQHREWIAVVKVIVQHLSRRSYSGQQLSASLWHNILQRVAPEGMPAIRAEMLSEVFAERIAEHSALYVQLLREVATASGYALRFAAMLTKTYRRRLRLAEASARRFLGSSNYEQASISAALAFDVASVRGAPKPSEWAARAAVYCCGDAWWPYGAWESPAAGSIAVYRPYLDPNTTRLINKQDTTEAHKASVIDKLQLLCSKLPETNAQRLWPLVLQYQSDATPATVHSLVQAVQALHLLGPSACGATWVAFIAWKAMLNQRQEMTCALLALLSKFASGGSCAAAVHHYTIYCSKKSALENWRSCSGSQLLVDRARRRQKFSNLFQDIYLR